MEPLKVIVLGWAGVGKSSLSLRFIKNEFPEEYEPTIENTYSKSVEVNGYTYKLDLLDQLHKKAGLLCFYLFC